MGQVMAFSLLLCILVIPRNFCSLV